MPQTVTEIINTLIDEIPNSAQLAAIRADRLGGDHPPCMKQIRYVAKYEDADIHTVAAIFGFAKCMNTRRWIRFDTVLDPDDFTTPEPLVDLTDFPTMCAAAAWSAENRGEFKVPYLRKHFPSERLTQPNRCGGGAVDPGTAQK